MRFLGIEWVTCLFSSVITLTAVPGDPRDDRDPRAAFRTTVLAFNPLPLDPPSHNTAGGWEEVQLGLASIFRAAQDEVVSFLCETLPDCTRLAARASPPLDLFLDSAMQCDASGRQCGVLPLYCQWNPHEACRLLVSARSPMWSASYLYPHDACRLVVSARLTSLLQCIQLATNPSVSMKELATANRGTHP